MALLSSDITTRLSGGASNNNANTSLGGVKSSNAAPSTLFDDVLGVEAQNGSSEYRCVYINNANGAGASYLDVKLWIQTNTPSVDTTIAIGLGTSGLNGTEQTVANETTAPIGVTFSAPTDYASGLVVGSIPAGQSFAYWIRRTVNPGAAAFADSYTIRHQGDYIP